MQRPTFRPHLRAQVVPGEGVFVVSDARSTLLRGRLYELVAPCLDGKTSADELCDLLREQASPAEVYLTLKLLERKEFLCEGGAGLAPGTAAFWSSLGVAPADAEDRLRGRAIAIQSLGVEGSGFHNLLQSLHIRLHDDQPDVVLADNYLRDELAAINRNALDSGKSWLLARPTGRQIWIGPLFRPGTTGCWACLAQRIRANSPIPAYLRERNGSDAALAGDLARTPATDSLAWGLAANAVAMWLVRGEVAELVGKIQTFDTTTWKSQSHALMQLPFCKECGSGRTREAVPLSLVHRSKGFTRDGGHRTIPPEETLERYGHHVSPIAGAVPLLERASAGGDGILHVYVAGANMARTHKSLAHLRGDLRNMSSGKGTTNLQAKASGLCEGLERYSGVYRGDEPRRRARMAELGDAAMHPNDCLLFSDRQYRERDALNARDSRFSFIPAPFNSAAEIDWSPVWSLSQQRFRYLPTAFCYYQSHECCEAECHEDETCIACSNGCAAGNTLEEAILQGFLELVERDSVALWWYNRVRRPGVDLKSFAEPYLDQLAAFLAERGREYWVLDLTSDLGIPVFTAISRRMDAKREQIALGFGAHLDPRLALLRAVTEMNQMLTSALLSPEARDDPHADPETKEWLATATIANQPYLLASGDPRTTATTHPRSWSEDLREDITRCQSRIEREGLEMLVLDQTRPEIGLPVVKVIVPGLRHFWARFAPGRLYDVPVKLGWLSRPLAESELNPIPMFL